VLRQHLSDTKANATYISKTTQNEITSCCDAVILDYIVQQVKLANCYPTEFDETTDAAHVSQLSLIVCYCCNGVRREDFVGFLDLHSSNYQLKTADTIVEPKVKGDTIASSVLRMLDSLDLCVNKCVGIGTDGCSILTSQRCGQVT